MNAMMGDRKESIGIDAVLLAIYFALSPMHQTLLLSNGGTVVKYAALLVMAACVAWGYITNRQFVIVWDLIWPVTLMLGWFVLTIVWSDLMSATIGTLISIGSYCAMMLIVGSRQWNRKEKMLLLTAILLSCLYYAITLVGSASTSRRATLSFTLQEDSKEADQNVVSMNLGLGALAALHCFLQLKHKLLKWSSLGMMFLIVLGMISTGSRGGVLSFSGGAVCMIYKQSQMDIKLKKRLILIVVVVLTAFWLIFDLNILQNDYLANRFMNTDVGSMTGRSEIWWQYAGTLISRPSGFLAGYGCGCETVAHAAYMGRDWYRASHNDIISILCWGGIPGLMLTGLFVLHIWRKSSEQGNYLGCACIILALIGSMDINFFKTYGWWNAMMIAYTGIQMDVKKPVIPVSAYRKLPQR